MTRGPLLSATASVLVAAVLLPASAAAAAPGYPQPDGRCVDRTTVLGGALCARVTKVLLGDEQRSRDEIAVAVVPTTGDASIESWTTGLFNTWKVGKADENNGVLLVVAVDDHRVRLETGRGMSTRLPDSAAKEIVDTVITPRFAAKQYRAGILDGLDEVRRRLDHPLDQPLAALAPAAVTTAATRTTAAAVGPSPDSDADSVAAAVAAPDPGFTGDDDGGLGATGWFIVAFIVLAFVALVATVRPTPGNRGSTRRRLHDDGGTAFFYSSGDSGSSWGGGGGDSGSGFGGGSSDGGGSSGGW